ncbi:MAG: hypothetical protein ACOCX1_00890 [Fimbriimonadaceae bacterium]
MKRSIASLFAASLAIQGALAVSNFGMPNSLDPVFWPSDDQSTSRSSELKALVVVQVEATRSGSESGRPLFKVLASDRGETGTIRILSHGLGGHPSVANSVEERLSPYQYEAGDVLIAYGTVLSDQSLQRVIDNGLDLDDSSLSSAKIQNNTVLQAEFLIKSDLSWASQERLLAQPIFHAFLKNLDYGSIEVQRTALYSLGKQYRNRYEHSSLRDASDIQELKELALVLEGLDIRPEARLELEFLKTFVSGMTQRHQRTTLERNEKFARELVLLAKDGISGTEKERLFGMPFFEMAPDYSLDSILDELYTLGVSWSPSFNHPVNYKANVGGLARLLRTTRPAWQVSDSEHKNRLAWLAALMSGDRELQTKVLQFTYSDKTRSEAEVEAHYKELEVALQEFVGSP